jgi:hypothetical protein
MTVVTVVTKTAQRACVEALRATDFLDSTLDRCDDRAEFERWNNADVWPGTALGTRAT